MAALRRRRETEAAPGWWVRQGEDVQGPFPLRRMQAWLGSGKLAPDLLVSRDRARWQPAGKVRALRAPRGSIRTGGWAFLRVMKEHTPTTSVTYVILGLNVGVYLVMVLAGVGAFDAASDDLLAWGGDYGPYTTNGQWWRLLTNMFVHGGAFHLFGNMLFFWYIGRFMERLVGQAGYGVLYVGSGLAGSLASLAWNASVVSVGASGALFGLFGGVLGFVARRDRDQVAQAVLRTVKNAAIAFLIWQIVFGLKAANVDHAAHLGGALGGFALGYLLGHPLTEAGVARRPRRALIAAGACLAVTVGVAMLLPRYADFRELVLTYARAEERLLPQYGRGRSGELDAEAFATALENELIPAYTALGERLRGLAPLPRQDRASAAALATFCRLRLEAFQLRLESLRADEEEARARAARAADAKEREVVQALLAFARSRR